MIQVIHSAYRCPNDEMPRDVRGRGVGYVGDRTAIANPLPVEIPPDKAWSFYTENAVVSGVDMVAHYGQDGVDPEGYWEPGGSASKEKACVSYLLAIPFIVAEFLMERERTGVELYNFLAAEAAKDNPMFTNGNHTLMMNWAVVSRQKNRAPGAACWR